MDAFDINNSQEKSTNENFETSVENAISDSPPNLNNAGVSCNETDSELQNGLENSEKQNEDKDLYKNAECSQNFNESQSSQTNSSAESSNIDDAVKVNTNNVVIVKTTKPLCADYKSDSDSESVDSESDSSTGSGVSTTDSSSEDEYTTANSSDSDTCKKGKKSNKKLKNNVFCNLPPIEDLKISVPEDACVEVGKITCVVDTLVVVESYKGTAALDLDTVLFLDSGKRALGKVFDILGPVTEPVYTVRFNSPEQIKNLNIKKHLKVYYAPKTRHTAFVFMSEVLKNRGSDASWKDNVEAPPEFQDFSDDEQERLYKNKAVRDTDRENLKEEKKSKKRPYVPSPGRFQTSGYTGLNFFSQIGPIIQVNPSVGQPLPRSPTVFNPNSTLPFPYPASVNPPIPIPRQVCFPTRFSGPHFPVFGNIPIFQNHNFQQPFYQQRAHGFVQNFGPWGRPSRPMFGYQIPPPPPPPPQLEHQPQLQQEPALPSADQSDHFTINLQGQENVH